MQVCRKEQNKICDAQQETNEAIAALDIRASLLKKQIAHLEKQRSRMTWVSPKLRSLLQQNHDRLALLYAKRSNLHDRAEELQENRVREDYDRLRDRLGARVG